MAHGRTAHTATVLTNGKVLIVGGFNTDFSRSVELYDPLTQAWRTAGRTNHIRMRHTTSLLSDGKLLLAGGSTDREVYIL